MATDDSEYLSPDLTERVLTALGEVEDGTAVCTPIEDLVAEFEQDPERKALLDKARAELRASKESGALSWTVRDITLTERGLRVESAPRA